MKKAKPLPSDQLTPLDLQRMLLSQAKLGEAKALHEMHARNTKHHAVLGELNALRLQAQTDRNLLSCRTVEKAAEEAHEAAKRDSRILAEEIAARYAVDWKTASYDPLTGAIVRNLQDA